MHINEHLDEALLEKVLDRLGFSNKPSVNHEDLTAIYKSWCQKIPFDNILRRIQMVSDKTGTLPGFSPAEFLEAWLATGVGGICWPGNGAFCVLLKTLGFPARRGISMMVPKYKYDTSTLIPRHGTVVVDFGEELMIVDTSLFHDKPIILSTSNLDNPHPLWGTSVSLVKNNWHIKWKPLGKPISDCKIEDLNASANLYANHHEIGRDLFNQSVIFRIARESSIEGIVLGNKVVRSADGTETSIPIDSEMTRKLLIENFGISEELVSRIPNSEIEKINY